MSGNNSTASTAGKATGNGSSGRKHFLGKTESLGEFVYESDTKDQADLYRRTTDAIADYVGVEYSKDMRMLIKRGVEKSFNEPQIPEEQDPSPESLEKYKAELNIYYRAKKEYTDHKSKVFVIILGQCSHELKSKVVNEPEYATLEDKDDVVGLLKLLKTMAFSTTGVQYPYWTMQWVLKRLTAINQGPNESVTSYHRRFLAITEVVETFPQSWWPPMVAPRRVSQCFR